MLISLSCGTSAALSNSEYMHIFLHTYLAAKEVSCTGRQTHIIVC